MPNWDFQIEIQGLAQNMLLGHHFSDVYKLRREDDNQTPSDSDGEAGAGLNFLNHFWA